jgi:hypothetical protein
MRFFSVLYGNVLADLHLKYSFIKKDDRWFLFKMTVGFSF